MGGEFLRSNCGKVLFPWVKKFKLPSGRYCCLNCYRNDLLYFTEIRESAEEIYQKEQQELEKKYGSTEDKIDKRK